MIKQFPFLLIAILAFSLNSIAQDRHACSRLKAHQSNFNRSARLSDDYILKTMEYDVTYYVLDINLERTSTDISGTGSIYATAVSNMETFLFELWDDFTISEIRLNGVDPVPFSRDESAVLIDVDFTEGESFFFEIDYAGTPPTGGGPLGGGGMTNDSSPSWGNQVTWSLSEPFAAYEWFPVKQLLTDKADSVRVMVTTDLENMAGSNGLLQSVTEVGGGKHRFDWKSNYPIDYYLISVSVAKYVEYTIYAELDGSDPIMIQNFIYDNPACLPWFESDIDETADYLEYYSEVFGLYPFHEEKYGHCMAPIGGGMEHQTMTTQGYFVNWLTAHELGHQWFGDNVTCASWADIWINEGFASYSEELMMAEFYPGDEIGHMADRHDNIMSASGGSVYVDDTLNVSRIFSGRLTYDKGAAIVHTFRFLLNDDDLFFQVLRDFQEAYKDGTARGDDFKAVAEATSGMDFTTFFNEWYYGEGFPTYSIEYANVGDEIVIVLNQMVSMPGVTEYFSNYLEIEVEGVDGYTEVFRLTDLIEGEGTFVFPFPEALNDIRIDPNNWIVNQDGFVIENMELANLVEQNISMSIYPNPTHDLLNVQLNGMETATEYIIYSETGQFIQKGIIDDSNTTIGVSELAVGVYHLQILNQDCSFVIE
ncbi:MAG: M1 family aminopeptidase [Crocinitomicaceae bacterium]